MKVIIVRSRAIDPSVKKIACALANREFTVHLLIWDRDGELHNTIENNYFLHYCRIHAPCDNFLVFFYLPFWWFYELLFLLRNSDKNTVIHACDLDTLWPAIMVKIIKKITLNYTIFDFYADNFPHKTPHFIRRSIASIEKIGLQFAHTVFLVDESRIQQIKNAKFKNIVYIYNTPEEKFLLRDIRTSVEQKEMILFYAGVLHEARGLSHIIQAIEPIADVKFLVAGKGPAHYLVENSSRLIKKKIKYLGWIPYNEVIIQTLGSDCIIALYDPSIPNNRYASPNKLFEAMMCKKPIIVNGGTAMANIVQEEKCGLIVPYGDIEAIKEAIIKFRDDSSLRQELGENGRKAYEQKYSWAIMEKRLVAVYENLRL